MAKEDLGKEREENGDDAGLKVTDRRLFTADGRLREEAEEIAEEPEVEATPEEAPQVEEEPQAEDPGFERQPVEEPEGVDFTVLVNAMAQPALIFLGEIPHPGTGQPEVNLEQARLQIDLLTVLRAKTRGNLSSEEDGLLDRLLYQLQLLYVERSGSE